MLLIMAKVNLKWFVLIIIAISMFSIGCEEENKDGKVEANGLTKKINDLVSEEILNNMKQLGMNINTGDTPPSIKGSYLVSPFILLKSNRPGDNAGKKFADYKVKFYNQDNENLEVAVDYVNGPEKGNGIGAFIVGNNNKFTVFAEMTSRSGGATAKTVQVLSGEIADNGIKNFYYANFMLDNNGNPNDVWIENGEGRVIYDSDGFSPTTSFKSSLVKSSSLDNAKVCGGSLSHN